MVSIENSKQLGLRAQMLQHVKKFENEHPVHQTEKLVTSKKNHQKILITLSSYSSILMASLQSIVGIG